MDAALAAVHASAEDRHWWFRARRAIVAGLAARVLPAAPVRIVDVGCGTGANTAALAPGNDAVGIDASPEAVRLARARFPGVRFAVAGDAEGLPWPAATAHLVLLMDVLEHVADDRALLRKWTCPLAPGAHVIVTVPGEPRLWSPHDVRMGHHRRYDRAGLDRLLHALPVEVRLLSPFNTRLHPLVRAARWLTRRLGRGMAAEGTDVFVPPAPLNGLLTRLFAGEAARLQRALAGRARPYRRGVSWILVLRRTDAHCA